MKMFNKKYSGIKTDTVQQPITEEEKVETMETETTKTTNTTEKDFKKKMFKIGGIIVIAFVVLMIILLIMSLFTKRQYTYEEVETVLKNAAVSYYKDHPTYLPVSDTQIIDIDDTTLSNGEYMKLLSEYVSEKDTCTGKVEVKKSGESFLYTPYLDCGESYLTTELYKQIINSENTITEGYGLYNVNNEYVYRGENVNNYVKLNDHLWRIVKVTGDNEVELIYAERPTRTTNWDDRYNEAKQYNSGVNTYSLSRIKDYLKTVYEAGVEDLDTLYLTDDIKEHLTEHNLCTGTRQESSDSKDNSVECSYTEQNQKIGLLTVSDYMLASTDNNCNSTIEHSCQNYNYLKIDYDWWLQTADSDSSFYVYRVSNSGYIEKAYASNSAYARPVIYFDKNTMFKSGKGTLNNPYEIR